MKKLKQLITKVPFQYRWIMQISAYIIAVSILFPIIWLPDGIIYKTAPVYQVKAEYNWIGYWEFASFYLCSLGAMVAISMYLDNFITNAYKMEPGVVAGNIMIDTYEAYNQGPPESQEKQKEFIDRSMSIATDFVRKYDVAESRLALISRMKKEQEIQKTNKLILKFQNNGKN